MKAEKITSEDTGDKILREKGDIGEMEKTNEYPPFSLFSISPKCFDLGHSC